jgi:hypothetical protein
MLLPQSADQFYNASRVSAAGNEPGFAERARAVRLETAAIPSPEEAWARIEQLSH